MNFEKVKSFVKRLFPVKTMNEATKNSSKIVGKVIRGYIYLMVGCFYFAFVNSFVRVGINSLLERKPTKPTAEVALAKQEKRAEEEARAKRESEAKAKQAEEARARQAAEEAEEERVYGISTSKVKREIEPVIVKTASELDPSRLKVTNVTVNPNMGTDSENDVVVLCDYTWDVKNSEKMTKEMVAMFSNDIAVDLAKHLADGSEIVLFCKAEYTKLKIKHSFTVKGGKAYRGDTAYSRYADN